MCVFFVVVLLLVRFFEGCFCLFVCCCCLLCFVCFTFGCFGGVGGVFISSILQY